MVGPQEGPSLAEHRPRRTSAPGPAARAVLAAEGGMGSVLGFSFLALVADHKLLFWSSTPGLSNLSAQKDLVCF